LQEMWKYLQVYRMAFGNQVQNVWYTMDELGSCIQHSDDPNVRVVPFIYLSPAQQPLALSAMWPIKDLELGEKITRDYVPKGFSHEQRIGYLCAWKDDLPENFEKFKAVQKRFPENQPNLKELKLEDQLPPTLSNSGLVYTDLTSIRDKISQELMTEDLGKAQIIWASEKCLKDEGLSQRIAENVSKGKQSTLFVFYCPFSDFFAAMTLHALFLNKPMGLKLATSFNLPTQLFDFVSEYHYREENKAKNHRFWLEKRPYLRILWLPSSAKQILPDNSQFHPIPKIHACLTRRHLP